MATKDYYELLGVARDAPPEAIKKAFRRLALKHHPDRNRGDPQAEERFKEAARAYEVLSDPATRAKYDQFGESLGAGAPAGAEGGAGDAGGGAASFDFDDFVGRHGDLFADLFGGQFHRARPRQRRGSDVEAELAVDFRTAALGGAVDFTIESAVACSGCGGRGARGEPRPCASCGGSGRKSRAHPGRRDFFTITGACPACGGSGVDPATACPDCRGAGVVTSRRQVKVTVPAGSEEGAVLRLAGLGGAGRQEGPPGDLLVTLRVNPDPELRRDGDVVHSDVRVPAAIAVAGGKAEAATLHGRAVVTIAPGTQAGAVLRLRKQGVRGADHLLHVVITVPEQPSDEERELWRKLAALAARAKE